MQAGIPLSPKPTRMRDWYQVNEIFASVQGEGVLAGSPAVFIRLQGCTVGCPWCDSGPLADELETRNTNGETKNTWGNGGQRMSVREIMNFVGSSAIYHVVITGGEPTGWALDGLLRPLRAQFRFVQMETSGQHALKGDLFPSWITWSPKERLGFDAPQEIKRTAQEIKFVVDGSLQQSTVEKIWNEQLEMVRMGLREQPPYMVLMPEGIPPTPESNQRALRLLELSREVGPEFALQWRFGDRLQYHLNIR